MNCPQCGTLNENTARECVRCKRPLSSLELQGKIACYIHANREATSHCGVSGKPICQQCTVTWNGIDYAREFAPPEALTERSVEDYEVIPVLDAESREVAPFANRLGAWLIDVLIWVGFAVILAFPIWIFSGSLNFLIHPDREPVGWWTYRILLFIAPLVYITITTAANGQTIGKQTMGVIVLRPDGLPINLQTSMLRTGMAIVSLIPLGLGFLWSLWDKEKNTWHDKVAGTSVFAWERDL